MSSATAVGTPRPGSGRAIDPLPKLAALLTLVGSGCTSTTTCADGGWCDNYVEALVLALEDARLVISEQAGLAGLIEAPSRAPDCLRVEQPAPGELVFEAQEVAGAWCRRQLPSADLLGRATALDTPEQLELLGQDWFADIHHVGYMALGDARIEVDRRPQSTWTTDDETIEGSFEVFPQEEDASAYLFLDGPLDGWYHHWRTEENGVLEAHRYEVDLDMPVLGRVVGTVSMLADYSCFYDEPGSPEPMPTLVELDLELPLGHLRSTGRGDGDVCETRVAWELGDRSGTAVLDY